MISIGPQVAFVDDKKTQIEELDKVLSNQLHTGTRFFDATPAESKYPEEPIDTIKLLFLDLFYNDQFDAYLPAQWVQRIIPPHTKYALIIWSKDVNKQEEVLFVLREIDLYPEYVDGWQKSDYQEVEKLNAKVHELISNMAEVSHLNQETIWGEIIAVEEDGVLINCRLNIDTPTFQVRKFDVELLRNINKLVKGTFVKIQIRTQPGTRVIEIFEEEKDHAEQFKVNDHFEGLKDTAFFIEE